MNEEEVLYEVAVLGEQMIAFAKSDVGKFILNRVDTEIKEAYNKFKSIEPNNVLAVTALQNQIWRAESLRSWINEAITAGLKAKEVLEERDE